MRWQVSPDVIWIGEEEVRLYDPARGEFETLNGSASAVWRLLDAGHPVGDVVAQLATQFGAGDEAQRRRIAADVEAFVQALSHRGMVRPYQGEDHGDGR